MRLPRLLREAWRNIAGARQRSVLALLGISVGAGSVVAMVHIARAAGADAEAQFRALGTDFFVVDVADADAAVTPVLAGQLVAVGPGSAPPRRARTRTSRQRAAILEDLARDADAVSAVAAVAFLKPPMWRNRSLEPAVALGASGSFLTVSRATVAQGRALTAFDAGRRFCVIGRGVAAKLAEMGARNPVGLALDVVDRRYTVVGVLAPAPRTRLAPYLVDDSVIVPIDIATRASQETVAFAIGRVAPGARWQHVAERVAERLAANEIQGRVSTAEELVQQMERQSRLFTLLLGAVGAISLVGGGIGVMNVMLSSLAERRREIALLRALGARRGTVQALFVAEALMLGVLGGSAGVAAGVLAARLLCRFSAWPFLVLPGAATGGFFLAVGTAVVFGWLPARQAARIPPMAALR